MGRMTFEYETEYVSDDRSLNGETTDIMNRRGREGWRYVPRDIESEDTGYGRNLLFERVT